MRLVLLKENRDYFALSIPDKSHKVILITHEEFNDLRGAAPLHLLPKEVFPLLTTSILEML